jgi:hypothetical protein
MEVESGSVRCKLSEVVAGFSTNLGNARPFPAPENTWPGRNNQFTSDAELMSDIFAAQDVLANPPSTIVTSQGRAEVSRAALIHMRLWRTEVLGNGA